MPRVGSAASCAVLEEVLFTGEVRLSASSLASLSFSGCGSSSFPNHRGDLSVRTADTSK